MTSPNHSQDVPLASVAGFGLSEATSLLVTVAGFLTVLFGKDFGVAKNAQAIAGLAFVLAPIGMGLARALKHHGVAHANALVLAAQATPVLTALEQFSSGRHEAPAGDPVTEPVAVPQPPEVGADLPVETVSTALPAA